MTGYGVVVAVIGAARQSSSVATIDDQGPHLLDAVTAGPRKLVRTGRGVVATVRNMAEVARFGGLETGERSSAYTVVADQANYQLRHYSADDASGGVPIVLIPPLMMSAEVWDVSPLTSAVARLRVEGADPWVVDFGDPGVEPGGLERTLTDHVLAVDDAVDQVHAATGREVVLAGYSQGGMFAYQTAALRRGEHIDSIVTFGSPVDTTAPLPLPVSSESAARLASGLVDTGVLRKVGLPSWAVRLGFQMLSPAKTVQGRIQFLLALHDRDSLLPREKQRRFLDGGGWTAYAGPAIAELLEQFVVHNRMLDGGFVIGDRLVTLADIDVPIMTVVGSTDTIGHPDSVRAIRRAAPKARVYELTMETGHFGLVVGSRASAVSWPAVAAWLRWRTGEAELPPTIVPAEQVETTAAPPDALLTALTQATELGIGAGRYFLAAGRRAARATGAVLSQAPTQLPKLSRLGNLEPGTAISLGLLLDEEARRRPEEIFFLFGDRAYRQREVKHRVDSVVRGLLSLGVRRGERIGVLMLSRPTALTLIAALSRIGATAVLLRPDGEPRQECELGRVSYVIADPENAEQLEELTEVRKCLLGGGAGPRETRPGVLDMEQIDPDTVELPAWYRANPHTAADLAFVLFTGEAATTRAVPISNRRWAMSALGTASAAALRPGDTVYSSTPHYHSSAALMSYAGAVAGGARFAMASSNDSDTFWEEVRRYGASHVSYTWTSLRDIAFAGPHPNEQHHPIRMFMGSGMPRNLWRRVVERFDTARVLEFYASAEGEAVLANVSGTPIGSLGRALPGTPEVRVAAFDLVNRRLQIGPDGFGRECEPDEVGLLLARVTSSMSEVTTSGEPSLRSVFDRNDMWLSTGDLFRRDDRGDLWLVDQVSGLVETAHGPVPPAAARTALEAIPAVDLCVAYGVPSAEAKVLVAAVALHPGTTLSAIELNRVFDRLPSAHRPDYVQVVPSIPVTTWHRPVWVRLRRSGIPKPTRARTVWRLAPDRVHYELCER